MTLVGALCAWSVLASTPTPAAPPDAAAGPPASAEALMQLFASGGGVRARFEETRRMSILADPIRTRGRLAFAPPDRLARITTEPGRSRVVVIGDRVAMTDETGHREASLRQSPVARSMVTNLMVLLRGDLAGLREQYVVTYSVQGGRWEIVLEPRDAALRALVAHVRASGQGGALTEIETLEANGDSTMSRLFEVEVGVDFDSPAAAGTFAPGPPASPR